MSSKDKSIKKQRTKFLILKMILFVFVLWIIYDRLSMSDNLDWHLFNNFNIGIAFIVFLLFPLNWLFEFIKWKRTLKEINLVGDKKRITNSFLAGFITGMLTPNMAGNFLGRMYYFDREKRVSITIFTLVSSLAQFLVTVVIGLLSIIALGELAGVYNGRPIYYVALIIIPISIIFYFFFDRLILLFLPKARKLKRVATILKSSNNFRWEILFYSFLRYLVFISQFVLIILALGVDFSFTIPIIIAQLFLVTTLIPSLFLGKLGIRESVSLIMFSGFIDEPKILFASLFIWIVNLLIPMILCLILVSRKND